MNYKKLLILLVLSLSFALVLDCGKKKTESEEEVSANDGLDPETKKGKMLFDTTCVPCHGPLGAGDGINSANLNPKPRNYKAPGNEWKNGKTVEGINKTLAEGVKGTGMASYSYLPPEDRNALAKYVLHLGK